MNASEAPSRPGRCWLCGLVTLREGDPLEHVIPAAIGGTLTTDRVCERCNNAASVIDQRFSQDWFVALERTKHELPDRKGKPPPHPKQKVRGKDDGTPYRINTMGGSFALEPVPQVHTDETGNVRISAASEGEAYRAAKRLLGDLEAQGFMVGDVRREKLPPIEVAVSLRVDPIVYVRETAKMTLGALSLVWPDEWLDSADAKRLQKWVRDDVPTDDDGNTIWGLPGQKPDLLKLICTPPEHLILLVPARRRSVGNVRAFWDSDPPHPRQYGRTEAAASCLADEPERRLDGREGSRRSASSSCATRARQGVIPRIRTTTFHRHDEKQAFARGDEARPLRIFIDSTTTPDSEALRVLLDFEHHDQVKVVTIDSRSPID